MTASIAIEVPGVPAKALDKGARGHWRTKKAAWDNALETGLLLWRLEVNTVAQDYWGVQTKQKPYPVYDLKSFPWDKVSIGIVQHWCSKPLDPDNLIGRCGAYLDAAVRAGVIVDDNPSCVLSLTASYERVQHRSEARVRIEIRRA